MTDYERYILQMQNMPSSQLARDFYAVKSYPNAPYLTKRSDIVDPYIPNDYLILL